MSNLSGPSKCLRASIVALQPAREYVFRTTPARPRRIESTRIAPFLAHEGSSLAKAPVEGDADIGSHLAPDFIAQSYPEFQVVETRAGCELLDSLYGSVGLEASLEDQLLRQQHVLGQRETRGHGAVLIDEQGRLEFIVVRHESLDPITPSPRVTLCPRNV